MSEQTALQKALIEIVQNAMNCLNEDIEAFNGLTDAGLPVARQLFYLTSVLSIIASKEVR